MKVIALAAENFDMASPIGHFRLKRLNLLCGGPAVKPERTSARRPPTPNHDPPEGSCCWDRGQPPRHLDRDGPTRATSRRLVQVMSASAHRERFNALEALAAIASHEKNLGLAEKQCFGGVAKNAHITAQREANSQTLTSRSMTNVTDLCIQSGRANSSFSTADFEPTSV